jgi:glutamate dehydrogenase
MFVLSQIMASSLPDSPLLTKDLPSYFPKVLQSRFKNAIEKHPLRREIIGNLITNSMVNGMGPTFLNEMMDLSNATAEEVTKAYLMVRESFNLAEYWKDVEALDHKVTAQTQYTLFLEMINLTERNTLWLLQHPQLTPHTKDVTELMASMDSCLVGLSLEERDSRITALVKKNVPFPLAKIIGTLPLMNFAYTILQSARGLKIPIKTTAHIFFHVQGRFGIDWLLEKMNHLGDSNWSKRALYGMRDQLLSINASLTETILKNPSAKLKNLDAVETWCQTHTKQVEKMDQLLLELKVSEKVDLNMIVVAIRQLGEMV